MRTAWQEHIGVGERQVRPVGGSLRVAVPHEDGGIAGYQIYHPDGRVSAEVHARPIKTEHSKTEFKRVMEHLGVTHGDL